MSKPAEVDPDTPTEGSNTDPVDLDVFLMWLRSVLVIEAPVLAEHRLREDLKLDEFLFFVMVLEFDLLTEHKAAINIEIFRSVATVRDLYLYYLTVLSMPRE